MVLGINLNDRNTQIGLGIAGTLLGATFLAARGRSEQKGISFDRGSIGSYEVDVPSESIFSYLYDRVIGSRHTDPSLQMEPLEEITPVEVDSEPVQIGKATKRTLLGTIGSLFKAIALLPVIVIVSIVKGIFIGLSSLIQNKVASS